MFGRSGKVAAALVLAVGGCSCESEPEPPPASPPPPAKVYDLEQPTAGLEDPRPRDDSFRRGVSFGPLAHVKASEERKAAYQAQLDEIVALGATDVQLVVHWGQMSVRANEIAPLPDATVGDRLLGWLMRQAKGRSLRVFLLPKLHVEEAKGDEWRKALAPTDPDRWWWGYRRFVMHYARIAQMHDAALFAVGSELTALEGEAERWRALIGDVRRVFKGPLTYAARWDHFEGVSFWDATDVASVVAYPPLAQGPTVSDEALRAGFQPFAKRLRSWAEAGGHRYVFAETGYPAQASAAVEPRDVRPDGKADPEMQLRCYRALYDVWQDDPRLQGLYVWRWSGEGGPDDPGHTPRKKPAQAVLAHWYGESRTAAAGELGAVPEGDAP